MIINRENRENGEHVKFVSYDGKCPNLCRGVLTLEIDGVRYKFGHHYGCYSIAENSFNDEDKDNPNFSSFWHSGGDIKHDKHWNWEINHYEWEIDYEEIPEQFRKYADEIDEVFNENVEWGCCGGCI